MHSAEEELRECPKGLGAICGFGGWSLGQARVSLSLFLCVRFGNCGRNGWNAAGRLFERSSWRPE